MRKALRERSSQRLRSRGMLPQAGSKWEAWEEVASRSTGGRP